MDWKNVLEIVLGVAVGMILAKIISSKLPASLGGNGTWEESYEEVN